MEANVGVCNSLRLRLRDRLREKTYPLFCFPEGAIPAASVWTGSRLWVEAFRAAGLVSGDRVLISLPPSPAWLQTFVAAVWEGLTIVLVPASGDSSVIAEWMRDVDARASIGTIHTPYSFNADWCAGPLSSPRELCGTYHPPTPDIRFLLRTSGTESGKGRWVALSEANVLSVIDSHLPHLGLREERSRVLSVLPWSHAFGLVIDLLPALLSGAEIHRDSADGRDAAQLLLTFENSGITSLCAVPLIVKRLMLSRQGQDFLRSLEGGVIGGAPLDKSLTDFLRSTRLRVGYGQTEGSPGIALGEPGFFPEEHYLGRALGCQVRESNEQTLQYRGANTCLGMWLSQSGFTTLESDRWQESGDMIRRDTNGDLFFIGRSDSLFKLSNGRRVEPEQLENTLRQAGIGAEHLLLYSDDSESLKLASNMPLEMSSVKTSLGSSGRLLQQICVVPTEVFHYSPKGTLQRSVTRNALRSHMLQFGYGNHSR